MRARAFRIAYHSKQWVATRWQYDVISVQWAQSGRSRIAVVHDSMYHYSFQRSVLSTNANYLFVIFSKMVFMAYPENTMNQHIKVENHILVWKELRRSLNEWFSMRLMYSSSSRYEQFPIKVESYVFYSSQVFTKSNTTILYRYIDVGTSTSCDYISCMLQTDAVCLGKKSGRNVLKSVCFLPLWTGWIIS